MSSHFVEDYEEVMGKPPEPSQVETMQAKVVEPTKKAEPKKTAAKVVTK